jgi:2-methylcitrate dehydratase PrpD
MSAKVRITVNGQTFETFVQVPMGEPNNFMSSEQFQDKFSGLCSPYITAPQRDHLSNNIMALESCTDLNAALFG